MPKKSINKADATNISPQNLALINDIRELIENARTKLASSFNVGQTLLCWQIGRRVQNDVLKGRRAEYGKEILATVSQKLSREYGNGYSYTSLTRMVKFAETFRDDE